jgi:Flp pilus assembly protein TadG
MSRRRRAQSAQAMILNAMMLVALIGFCGLAIDGGRLYWERRTLQNAVDAAALAASDYYQDNQSVGNAVAAAAKEYAANERIYSAATVSGSGANWQATWSTSSDVMKVKYTSAGQVSSFDISSTHTVQLAFMAVLGAGKTATVSTVAQGHAKTGGTSGAALVALSQGNCTGGSDAISTNGGGSGGGFTINNGDVRDNGSVSLSGSHATINNSGSWYDNCTCPVPANVTVAGTKTCGAAPVADPGFSLGPTSYYQTNRAAPASNVNLSPGVYASNLAGNSSCYFLEPGIYTVSGGVSNNSGFLANYLKPPDEPNWNTTTNSVDYTTIAANKFWPSGCAGSFSVSAVIDALALSVGNWGVIVTSTRTETWPPAGGPGSATYRRESFPSMCHSVTTIAGQAIKVTINNVAGATGYNVYLGFAAAPGNACNNGKWGYATTLNVPNATYSAETTSAMGSESVTINTAVIGTASFLPANITAACDFTSSGSYSIGCAAATGAYGSANPPGDGAPTGPEASGLYSSDPARDVVSNGGGDRANPADCRPRYTDPAAPCAGAFLTPGGVQLYFPSGSACLSMSSSFTLPIFSGYQFNWIGIYGHPGNACGPQIKGTGGLRMRGALYWPKADLTVQGNGYTSIASEVIVSTISVGGNGDCVITYDYYATPSQGYSQLSI